MFWHLQSAMASGNYQQTIINDIIEQNIAKENGNNPVENGKETNQTLASEADSDSRTGEKYANIDVDFTALSSTMVYSEVYNMMVSPEAYIGKTVKMKGLCAYYHDEQTGNDYYTCIIQDANACCAQEIEFVLAWDSSYPEANTTICVVGVI